MEIDYKKIMDMALICRRRAYAPYSNFKVGAALLTKSGKIYTGCNVENSSYGATICAERVAVTKAISEGERDFVAIAIVGGRENETDLLATPCGICLQFLREFCDDDFKIILYNGKEIKSFTLKKLFPDAFNKDNIK